MQEKPLFLDNPEWYTYSEEDMRYYLTDKATPEAKTSYERFYAFEDAIGTDI